MTRKKYIIAFIILIGIFFCKYADASSVNYFIYDRFDRTVTALTDGNGVVVNAYKYNGFGNVVHEATTINNVYRYAGEQRDSETGLIYLRNRYYNPALGRFITKDPFYGRIQQPQTINSYIYVSNNPLSFIDPLGLSEGKWRSKGFGPNGILYIPWLRVYHSQYFPGNNEPDFGFMDTGKVEQERKETLKLYHKASSWDKRDDDVMAKARIEVNVWWGEYFGLPKGGSFLKPWTWGQWRLWHWHNCQDYKRSVDRAYYRVIKKDKEEERYYAGGPWNNGGGGGGGSSNTGGGIFYHGNYNHYFPSTSYGGVSLSKTAELMLNIQDIDGAAYDEASGQVILFGKHNISLPNMELDDLAVAVRSVYGVSKPAQDPGVSLDEPIVSGQWTARYDGETANTKFGSVMFEADRLMKCMGVGKDNISGEIISSDVSGYKNLLERFRDAGSAYFPEGELKGRFWFVPKEVTLVQSEDRSSMVFDKTIMQVMTESKFKDNVAGNPCLEDFVSHFTQNYDAFAEERPVFKDLKRLAKITAVVKWIKDNNIPFDLSFFKDFIPQFYETAQYTPVVSGDISWSEGNKVYNLTVSGGVTYKLDASNFSTSTNALADENKQEAVNARPADTDFMWDFNGQGAGGQNEQWTAIAQSLSRSKKDGNVSILEVDMSFPIEGDNPVSFVRYYDSFYDKSIGFGKGWQVAPYALRFPGSKSIFTFGSGALSVNAHYQIFVREGTAEYLYTLAGLDSDTKPLYTFEGGSHILKDMMDGTFLLYRRNQGSVIFDNEGNVTKVTDSNGISIDYKYGGSKLISITGGGRGFGLNYDGDKITSITGPWEREVTYTYYPDGQLKTATDDENQATTYYYDSQKRLIKIDDPKGNRDYQAVYDDYNRASSETIGTAQYSNGFNLTDRLTTVTDPNNTQTSMLFDADYRILQSKDFLDNKVNFSYDGQRISPSIITDAQGKITEYRYDSLGNVCFIKDALGNENFFFYDSRNNLVAWRDELGRDTTYSYDSNNRLVEIHHDAIVDYDPQSGPPQAGGSYNQTYDPEYITKFTYDPANGNLLSAVDPASRTINITYDSKGMPLTITSASGYQTTAIYDNLSRLLSLSNQGGETVSFEYDAVDRIKKITSVGGSVQYTYDKNGNIDSVRDGKDNSTGFGYDNDNNLGTVTDAEGGITSYEYDVAGNITKITLPNGTTKELFYDEAGRQIMEINRRQNPAPQIVVLSDNLDFGSVPAGSPVKKEIKVYNIGDETLNITDISTDNGNFTVTPASAIVPAHADVTLEVTFTASSVGTAVGNLTIHSNDSKNPTVIVSLSGEAKQQSLNITASSCLSGMNISWDKYTGAGSFGYYNIYRSETEITDISALTAIQTINNIHQITYLDTTTALQNKYYYSVVAFDTSSNRLTPVECIGPVTYLNIGRVDPVIDIAFSSHNEFSPVVSYNNSSKEYLLLYEYDTSGIGSNYDIYGQRISENGDKIGSAFAVLNSGYNERNPQVAWNSSRNEYVVVCEYDRNGAGTYKIRAQRLSSIGSLLGSPIDNPSSTYTGEYNPCVVYNSVDNGYIISFECDYYNTGREQIMLLVCDADGNPCTGHAYSGNSGVRFKKCKLAYNPSQNNYLGVFEYIINDTRTYVVGIRLDSNANMIGGLFGIGNFLNNDMQPAIVYDSSRNEYVVIWQFDDYYGTPNEYRFVIRKVSADGVPGSYQIYSAAGKSFLFPSAALFSVKNEYIMTITGLHIASNEYNIFSQRISAVDLSLLTNSSIGIATESSVQERKANVCFNSNKNEFLIAYERQSGTDCNVHAQRVGELTTLLKVEPSSLNFGTGLIQQTIQVSNISGQNYMHLENSNSKTWFDVSPSIVDVNADNPTAALTVIVNRDNLPAGTYSGNIIIICEGVTTDVPVAISVANLPPNSPTNPAPETGAQGQPVLGLPLRVALSWQCSDPQRDALTYDMYLSDNHLLVENTDSSVLLTQNHTVNSYVSPALCYNKTYYWRVKSKDSGGLTALGDVWSFTTPEISMPALIPYVPDPLNNRRPVLKWDSVDGSAGYRIQIDDNSDFSSPILDINNVITAEYTPSLDLPEGNIYWRVSAMDGQGGYGLFSANDNFLIDVTVPARATLIDYTPNPTKIQKPALAWNTVLDASLYHVQISSASDFSALLFNGYVSEPRYTPISDLPEGKVYWRVSAKDLAGNEGIYSNIGEFTIDITPPGPVQLLSIDGKKENIEIRWELFNDTAGDFHYFNIYRDESVITNVSGLTAMNQLITGTFVTGFIDVTVLPDKKYYYAVTAIDTAGNEYKQVTSLGPVSLARSPVIDWVGESGYENDGLDPEAGSGSTEFTFKIKYTDLDGSAPAVYKIYIDKNGDGDYLDSGEDNNMTASGSDYKTGVIYTYSTTIPYSQEGSKPAYYFSFSDGLQPAAGNITKGISEITAIYKPDIFQTLSLTIDRADWQLLNISAGSEQIMDDLNNIKITNTGDGLQTYSLEISDQGGWVSSIDKNGADIDTFVLSAVFAGESQTGIDSGYFNETANDDVLLSGIAERAGSARFGSSRLLQNGSLVAPAEARSLWLNFKAPAKDTTKGSEHSVKIIISAEAP